ncbi:MAG TPA: sigma-70 family RNA polymerase sigma factor [Polyangia bacterium]|jgi:RNA polymerase sigma-70 factor (ECF subfamily)|nr:sigma-70 family RNA polymerase sigma factor [Polyangia bacterium]
MTANPPTALATASDGALATAVIRTGIAGSPAEEAELCRRFGRRVRLYGQRWLRDGGDVDDLVQRVLLLLVIKLRAGEVREPERIDSFVLGTARLVTRELSRRVERAELDEEMPCPLSETRPDPLALDRLAECVKALAERDRTVVSLTFFHEQSAAEAGEALGMQPGHVRITRHRALVRLRSCMGLGIEEVPA